MPTAEVLYSENLALQEKFRASAHEFDAGGERSANVLKVGSGRAREALK